MVHPAVFRTSLHLALTVGPRLPAVLARDQLVTQHRGAMEDLATLGLALISLDLATAELVDQTLNSVGEIDPVTHPIFGSSLFSVSDRSQTPQERYNALIRCDGGVRTQLILAHAPGRQRRLTAFGSGVSTGFCVCLFVGWFAHIVFLPPPTSRRITAFQPTPQQAQLGIDLGASVCKLFPQYIKLWKVAVLQTQPSMNKAQALHADYEVYC